MKTIELTDEQAKLKCWFGGSACPEEYDYVAACFAPDRREAKRLLWGDDNVRQDCDWDYFMLRVRRKNEYDSIASEPGLVDDPNVLRQMGWRMEGDELCASCGLATMDGEYPLCADCDSCKDCGHEDGCKQAKLNSGEVVL